VLQAFGHARPKLHELDEAEGHKLLPKCRPPISNLKLAHPLKNADSPKLDLTAYQVVTVTPFKMKVDTSNDSLGSDFADDIHEVLKNSFAPYFREVRFGTPSGSPDELLIQGTITAYKPGNRTSRLFIPGAGTIKFDVDIEILNGSTKQVLLSGSLDKFWLWGGALGVAKGIDDIFSQSAIAVAATGFFHLPAQGPRP
jgi:Domain of unknown function (DUF4410)